jgi:CHASE3 domain sensor protein
MSLLKDVEIGHRGYTFTGERNLLAPYSTAKSEISFAVQKLKNDTVDIEQKVNRMLTILANSVELKKQDKRTEKECLQDAADAKVIMDNLREEVKPN